MAFGILGALAPNEIEIDDRECVTVSYPGFWQELERVTT
jgi:5-enolpyruvylshikimate-3-phosphate synthase